MTSRSLGQEMCRKAAIFQGITALPIMLYQVSCYFLHIVSRIVSRSDVFHATLDVGTRLTLNRARMHGKPSFGTVTSTFTISCRTSSVYVRCV